MSFSSVMMAETRVRDSSLKSSPNALMGMDAHAPLPQRLRARVQNVPLPLLPRVEYSHALLFQLLALI